MKYIQDYTTFEKKKHKIECVSEEEQKKQQELKDKNLVDTSNPNEPVTGVKTDSSVSAPID